MRFMQRLRPHVPRTRRARLLAVTGACLAGLATFMIASAAGALSDSTFNTQNGDLTSNSTTQPNDWNPKNGTYPGPIQPIDCGTAAQIPHAGVNCGTDLVKSGSDNSFGQGSKEDTPSPTVVSGAIPPNKDDLMRFYVNKEETTSGKFLHLAWERSNLLGSAHMDFEFNQSQTPSANGVTPIRSAGDVLITFDFGGSGQPDLGVDQWLTSANTPKVPGFATNTCLSANSFPCWGDHTDLSQSGLAVGSVNSQTVTDNNPPNNPTSLIGNSSGSTFGEASIDLQAIFAPGKCENLGSAYLKSRSSGSSFTSALKDFIAPVPVSISNCGSLLIHKTDGTNGLAGATFTATPGSTDANGNTAHSSTFTDESPAHTGYYCLDNMLIGQQTTVKETAAPPGYNPDPNSQTLTVSNSRSCADRLADQSITQDGQDFVDTPQVGAIKITKTGKDKNCTDSGVPTASCAGSGSNHLGGAVFQLKDSSGTVKYTSLQTDGTTGVACIDGVAPGAYTLHESTTPNGYQAAADSSVTIAANTACNGTGTSAPLSQPVVDQPLTTITTSTTPDIPGATTSTVKCVNSTPNPPGGGTDTGETTASNTPHTTKKLVPGTYDCTVVIDP